MNQTIYERFRSVVAEHGEEPAVIETVRTLTFSELSDMVDMIAKKMPADTKTVGVVLNHTAEMIATMGTGLYAKTMGGPEVRCHVCPGGTGVPAGTHRDDDGRGDRRLRPHRSGVR